MGHYVTKRAQDLAPGHLPYGPTKGRLCYVEKIGAMPPVGGGVRSGLWEAVEENGNVSKGVMVRAAEKGSEKGSECAAA